MSDVGKLALIGDRQLSKPCRPGAHVRAGIDECVASCDLVPQLATSCRQLPRVTLSQEESQFHDKPTWQRHLELTILA